MQNYLGQTIRKYRHLKGYSIADLSEKLNISTGLISNIETGKGDSFQLVLLNSIIEELNIPLNEIHIFDIPATKNISTSNHDLSINLEFLNTRNQEIIIENLDNLVSAYLKTIEALGNNESIKLLTNNLIAQLNLIYSIKNAVNE